MPKRYVFVFLLALSTSCASVFELDSATASGSTQIASAYWFRGTPVNERGVYQGNVSVSLPTESGSFYLSSWANVDASNATGDAISPDGNGGKLTEIDYVAAYSWSTGAYDQTLGLVSYNFPNGVGASTTELYFTLGTQALGLYNTLSIYHDFDNVEGTYFSLQGSRNVVLSDKLTLGLSGLVGYITEDQANAYFGAEESGLSDLSLSSTLSYSIDDYTSAFLSVNGVVALDSDLRDALDASGYEDGGVWVALGLSWGF